MFAELVNVSLAFRFDQQKKKKNEKKSNCHLRARAGATVPVQSANYYYFYYDEMLQDVRMRGAHNRYGFVLRHSVVVGARSFTEN